MLVLRTDCDILPEARDAICKYVKEHTGEDCFVLTCGLTIERFPCAKDRTASIKRLAKLLAQAENDINHPDEMLNQYPKKESGSPRNQRGQKRRLVLIFTASIFVGLILKAFLESYSFPAFFLALLLFFLGALLTKLFIF